MCIHARLLCFKNLLSLKGVRQAKSSVFLLLPSLICLLALSLKGGLVTLSSVASQESDSACFSIQVLSKNQFVYVVVNFLSQVIFLFLLFQLR